MAEEPVAEEAEAPAEADAPEAAEPDAKSSLPLRRSLR